VAQDWERRRAFVKATQKLRVVKSMSCGTFGCFEMQVNIYQLKLRKIPKHVNRLQARFQEVERGIEFHKTGGFFNQHK
jgi:hypothetical protein